MFLRKDEPSKENTEKFTVDLPSEPTDEIVETPKAENKENPKKGTWVEINGLPSRNLAYPEGSIVRYRPYNFDEIEDISDSELSFEDHYEMVLNGIETVGFDKRDLTLGDFLFIMLNRKITTLGTDEFVVHFSYNGEAHKHIMRVFDVKYDDIEAPELPIIITTGDGTEVEFMPITVGQYLDYMADKDKLSKTKESRALLACGVTNLDFWDAYKLITESMGMDAKYFATVDRLLYHSIQDFRLPVKEYVDNPKYSEDLTDEQKEFIPKQLEQIKEWVNIEVNDDSMLLMPFRREGSATGDGIRFGKG
ncbi:hypothetical protein GR7B_00138 [Vibrio phage vB_VcorM_GR7B]|nr:hypothetical protein GR7B_00138 [Vibrio phage vB_VcorM_GR7B]